MKKSVIIFTIIFAFFITGSATAQRQERGYVEDGFHNFNKSDRNKRTKSDMFSTDGSNSENFRRVKNKKNEYVQQLAEFRALLSQLKNKNAEISRLKSNLKGKLLVIKKGMSNHFHNADNLSIETLETLKEYLKKVREANRKIAQNKNKIVELQNRFKETRKNRNFDDAIEALQELIDIKDEIIDLLQETSNGFSF